MTGWRRLGAGRTRARRDRRGSGRRRRRGVGRAAPAAERGGAGAAAGPAAGPARHRRVRPERRLGAARWTTARWAPGRPAATGRGRGRVAGGRARAMTRTATWPALAGAGQRGAASRSTTATGGSGVEEAPTAFPSECELRPATTAPASKSAATTRLDSPHVRPPPADNITRTRYRQRCRDLEHREEVRRTRRGEFQGQARRLFPAAVAAADGRRVLGLHVGRGAERDAPRRRAPAGRPARRARRLPGASSTRPQRDGDGARAGTRPSRAELQRARPAGARQRAARHAEHLASRGAGRLQRRPRPASRGDARGRRRRPKGLAAPSPSPSRSTRRSSTELRAHSGLAPADALVLLDNGASSRRRRPSPGTVADAGRPDATVDVGGDALPRARRAGGLRRPERSFRRAQPAVADRRRQLVVAQPAAARPARVARARLARRVLRGPLDRADAAQPCRGRARRSRAAGFDERVPVRGRDEFALLGDGVQRHGRPAAGAARRSSTTSARGCAMRSPASARRSPRRTTRSSCCA